MLRHGMKSCVPLGWLCLTDRFQLFLDNGFRHQRDPGTEIAKILIKNMGRSLQRSQNEET
jgi:hypothetical protein